MYYPSTHNNQTHTHIQNYTYMHTYALQSNIAPYCHTYERVLF